MTKYQKPVPHTPLPTSLRGVRLRNTVGRLRDSSGLVHEMDAPNRNGDVFGPACDTFIDEDFEDTLADVTCLWCIAGTQR